MQQKTELPKCLYLE